MLERGRVVKSLAGRDCGKLLAVIEADEKTALVCDGKERPVDRPKRKNVRHLLPLDSVLDEETIKRNKALKKALSQAEINCDKQEG